MQKQSKANQLNHNIKMYPKKKKWIQGEEMFLQLDFIPFTVMHICVVCFIQRYSIRG